MPFLIIHEYNWSHLIFLGTTTTKTSFWKQLANAMSTDLSVIFKAFWATVPRKFIKWLIWNWKKKKKIDFFTYMKKEIVKKLKKKLFYKIQKNREKKIIPSNRRISSPTYSKSERRLAPPKSVGSKSASHEKRIQVRASLAENKKALLLCGPSYGIYLMIKNITVMWISLLLLKKELKKFVIVYFFDVVSVKEPKNLEKMPKNVVCDRQFFCLNFCEIKL